MFTNIGYPNDFKSIVDQNHKLFQTFIYMVILSFIQFKYAKKVDLNNYDFILYYFLIFITQFKILNNKIRLKIQHIIKIKKYNISKRLLNIFKYPFLLVFVLPTQNNKIQKLVQNENFCYFLIMFSFKHKEMSWNVLSFDLLEVPTKFNY